MDSIQISPREPHRLSLRLRLVLAAVGLGLLAPLGIATRLQPDPRGQGTHQQLGLPPCTFLMLIGNRCPSCGMTTSWAYAVRGQWVRSAATNAGGFVLALVAAVLGPWLVASAALGRWLTRPPQEGVWAAGAVVVVVIVLADWAYRLKFGL